MISWLLEKKHNHSDHNQALAILLDTARSCNVRLNYEKLQYKKNEVDFFVEIYTTRSCKTAQSKVAAITTMPAPTCKKQVQSFLAWSTIHPNSQHGLWELVEPIGELSKEKVPFNWGSEHKLHLIWWKSRLPAPQY